MKINSLQGQEAAVSRADRQQNKQKVENGSKQENGGSGAAAKVENGSINASGLNLLQDDILNKKQKAQKEAMDYILDQFGADGEIDQNMDERRTRISESKETMEAANKEINEISGRQEQLKEEYGITDDSQEQQDYELLLKQRNSMKPGSTIMLSGEETERLKNMGSKTDYQTEMLEYEGVKDIYRKEREDAQKEISGQTGAIRATKLARLEQHGMVDAEKAADAALKAASKEVVGMLVKEAQDEIKKEQDEIVEKAEEEKEKKEEQEAKLEEKKEENQKTPDNAGKIPEAQKMQKDMEENIKQILDKQKLLDEDIKGIKTDVSV